MQLIPSKQDAGKWNSSFMCIPHTKRLLVIACITFYYGQTFFFPSFSLNTHDSPESFLSPRISSIKFCGTILPGFGLKFLPFLVRDLRWVIETLCVSLNSFGKWGNTSTRLLKLMIKWVLHLKCLDQFCTQQALHQLFLSWISCLQS